jgi:hypothetical protein
LIAAFHVSWRRRRNKSPRDETILRIPRKMAEAEHLYPSVQRNAERASHRCSNRGGDDMNSTTATTARLIAATALMLGVLTTACYAYSAEQEQLCTGDAMRLCSSEIPDVDRVTACMIQKRASLSEGCKSVFHAPTTVSYQQAPRPSKPVNLVPTKMR